MIYYIVCFVIIFVVNFNRLKIERFIGKLLLTGEVTEKKNSLDYNEIFPLKKYKFYNRYVWGPAKHNYLLKYYHNDKYDVMKFMKHPSNGKYTKLVSFKPADINIKNYRYKPCTKDTKQCVWPHSMASWGNKNPYTDSEFIPNCCASHLTEMLFYLHKLFKKHKIKYFIYWGTLLGAIRHGGIIPIDEDIDIYINRKEYTKLKKLKPIIEKTTHYELSVGKDITRLHFSKKNNLHVDIFYYD